MIEKIISSVDECRFDRASFKEFADFSLVFDIVFFFKGSDYNKYLKDREIINLEIKKQFANEKIEFAYPTQTIFVKK